jgi:CRISPR-associated endonuclease Csn1
MKKILGLDLGTNSIGWALIEQNFEEKQGKILGMGSRIIPMSQDILDNFGAGKPSKTQTSERTTYRSTRHLRERHLLRRDRLHRILNVLDFLPEHYSKQIDFEKRLGQFLEETEPKLAYSNKTFIFKKSFEEMLEDFKNNQPKLLNRKNKKGEDAKIPYDWTIYYLRKKALSQKLEKGELAWLLLNFNQKRGYYQLRGEDDDETPNKLVEFHSLRIVDVVADEQANSKGDLWFSLHLENGWVYRRTSKTYLSDWKDKTRDFIVTTDLNDDGSVKTDKEGGVSRSYRAPGEDDWTLLKKKTENDLEKHIKEYKIKNGIDGSVGTYIYDTLLQKLNQKIRGKLVHTIERKFYKDELKAILKKQIELQPDLFTNDLHNDCVRELYRHNEAHQFSLSKRDFIHLLVEDILFYQRPLKSKKSSIGNCSLEFRKYKSKDKDGKEIEKTEYLKGIPKSHPLYQEFRVWQWLYNLKIYKKAEETDTTQDLIKGTEDLGNLFEFLMEQKEVDHKSVLKHLFSSSELRGKALHAEIAKFRWNYVYNPEKDESKKYPCNETGYEIRRLLKKVTNVPANFLTTEIEQHLWHIIYSVTDKNEFEKALKSFALKHRLDEDSFVENFRKFKPFESDYGSYSEKAIKKLLPLMRLGKYWNWGAIDSNIKDRIEKILTGECDEEIKNRVREKAIHLTEESHFQGLQLWLAQYIVYDRHSEAGLAGKWKSVTDLEKYLHEFKQHSLRNPIVEQVVTETLRVVKDIWTKYGNGAEGFFSEIHIELGREMKNTAEDRKKITNQISDNESTNLRIKALISELKNDPSIQNVRPYSPTQQEALKIYEDGVLSSIKNKEYKESEKKQREEDDEMLKVGTTAQPSKSELIRYKLWLEQKYRSPYTGQMIPLNRLFTEDYQIEHVIPQSRYFDDSLSNKVICEAAVNQLKDNQLGLEFIKNHHSEIVETGIGNKVKIFTEDEYKDFIKQHYDKNRGKRNKLLLEEIPDKMIERQLNDTRYISKFISNLLSNVVRADQDDDGVNSKNVIPGNGKITSMLKQDWGLNDVWNELILPRYERMNQLTQTDSFTSKNASGKTIPVVPLELSKGFQKKRIDHRHHALDALVIACATRDHVNLLNNKHAKSKERFDLNRKLRQFEKVQYRYKETGNLIEKEIPKDFQKPWGTITTDARNELARIVVSFKQNLRVINKTTNKYESYKDENGNLRIGKDGKPKKEFISQTKGDSWAVRKSMHKAFVFGKVELQRVKIPKDKIAVAIRRGINPAINLDKITDTGIQKILKNYLESKGNDPELAFSPTGLEDLNNNIEKYNDNKPHRTIYKVRTYETGSRFSLGVIGNKKDKYVETADGTNLFYAVYKNNETGKRMFETVPLNEVIEHQKQQVIEKVTKNSRIPIPIKRTLEVRGEEVEVTFLFTLSPNDLVYVPNDDEKENINGIDFGSLSSEQIKRIFVVNDFSSTCYFSPNHLAKNIAPKEVDLSFDINKNKLLGSYDTKTASFDGNQIKDICIKLKVNRLGDILNA